MNKNMHYKLSGVSEGIVNGKCACGGIWPCSIREDSLLNKVLTAEEIAAKLDELKLLGITVELHNNTIASDSGTFYGVASNTHQYMTRELSTYRIRVYLDNTEADISEKIEKAFKYLDDRKEYANSHTLFSRLKEIMGI